MASCWPSLLTRTPSTPPSTSTSSMTPDCPETPKPFPNLLTPPTSPIRSRSSSNLSQISASSPRGQSLLAKAHDSLHPARSGLPQSQQQQQQQQYDDEGRLICPFEVEVLHDSAGQDQIFGYGAWSTVLKATARTKSVPSNFSLVTPPSSPTLSPPVIVAVKRPARSDARQILGNEAKILSYLAHLSDSGQYVVPFHGIIKDEISLVMAAMPFSLEDHIKRCSVVARRILTTSNMSQPVIGYTSTWLRLAHSMVSALSWLHNVAGVVHGDIKPANFLLQPKTVIADNEFPFQPLFIDFSSSHRPDSNDTLYNTLSAVTREYTAPELLVSAVLRDPKSTATKASDVFSLAVTLLVASTGDTMVYSGSIFQRQAMATQGWQVLSLVRSGESGMRVPRHGIVERALEKAVLRANMGRVDAGKWLVTVEEMQMGKPQKKLQDTVQL